MNTDLFPETLLVTLQGDRVYTTSRKVAEFSGKRHDDVLKAIDNKLKALPEDFRRRNFAESFYLNQQKKRQRMVEMTEEGFAMTMMGFTGKQAGQWQVDFIEAFMAQRAALAQITARYADALDIVRPCLRPTVEGTEQGANRASIAGTLGKSVGAVSYHRNQARRFGLLPACHQNTSGGAA
jgi:Rha family phage regulatory protein